MLGVVVRSRDKISLVSRGCGPTTLQASPWVPILYSEKLQGPGATSTSQGPQRNRKIVNFFDESRSEDSL